MDSHATRLRQLGRVLVWIGQFIGGALVVLVPVAIVVFDLDILQTTLVSLVLMVAVIGMVLAGDRLARPAIDPTLVRPEGEPDRRLEALSDSYVERIDRPKRSRAKV
ncbi:MAG TPA: hypothetical protein VIL42_09915 [Sphingomicrobium sp.]